MKRIVSLVVALMLCLTAFAVAESGYTLNDTPGAFPIAEGDATLTVFGATPSYTEDMDTNYATLWYEEKTGIHVNWMLTTGSDFTEKLNMMLAANDIDAMPDVIFNGFARSIADAYGSQGILLDLTDLIEEWGVNIKALREHNPNFVAEMTSYDGGIYFVPRYWETVHTRGTQKIWMNMKWLENVGMEVPTTTDEFKAVLQAFKDQDANGNGDPDDEIPLLYFTEGYSHAFPNGIMNAFTYWSPEATKLYWEGDVLTAEYATEGYREGLKYLKDLYDLGLIDNELFSMTKEQSKALGADPNGNRVGVTVGGTIDCIEQTSDTIFEFEVIEPLEGPSGLRETAYEFVGASPAAALTANCKDPEMAYRWLDAMMYDSSMDIANGDFTWLNFWYGEQGVGWDVASEGAVNFAGEPAVYKWLFNWGDIQNTHWYECFPINMPEQWKLNMEASVGEGYNQEAVLYKATKEKMEPFFADKTLHIPSLEEDDSIEAAEISSVLNTYRDEMMAKFIRGEADLDADWDAYLAELENIGLSRLIELYSK